MSSPKPFTSLAELREWHVAQAENYGRQAVISQAFAVSPVGFSYTVASAYRERAKHYRKMAQVHVSAAELLDATIKA